MIYEEKKRNKILNDKIKTCARILTISNVNVIWNERPE